MLACPAVRRYIDMMNLNDFLRGKTLTRGGRCYGSIIHFGFEGGAIETAGGDWTLEVDDRIIEKSETIEDSTCVGTLVGRTIRGLAIVTPDICKVTFWDGSVLRCRNGAREGYGMGRELLNVFQDDPTGKGWICELHAPLVDLSWRHADRPVSASY